MPARHPVNLNPDMDWTSLRERLRRIVASGDGMRAGPALPLTAAEAARLLARPPRNGVQEIVRRALARFFPPTQPPTHAKHG